MLTENVHRWVLSFTILKIIDKLEVQGTIS